MLASNLHCRMLPSAAALALTLLGPHALLAQEATEQLRVDGGRLYRGLLELGEIGREAGGGAMRMSFTPADMAARALVSRWLQAADLQISVDAAGNLIGRKLGANADLPPIVLGSHIDSVPQGGRFDGPLGSLAAIEVAQTLADRGLQLEHPLEVIIFSNEENGKTGSKALAGEVSAADLEREVVAGLSIAAGIELVGGEPEAIASLKREAGSIAAFLELHIEQGALLEAAGVPIGVVQGIVGIKRWRIEFTGFANHAGTTPMSQRQDALVAAAQFITAVHRIAKSMPGRQVATVGKIEAQPGAANVIPGRTELSLEIRDLEMAKIEAVYASVKAAGLLIAEESGTEFSAEEYYKSEAAPTDQEIQALISKAADDLGLRQQAMPSGAGHDAQSIAQFAPIGMIFVPSRAGISHSPEEYSSREQVTAGANVLLQTVLALDRR